MKAFLDGSKRQLLAFFVIGLAMAGPAKAQGAPTSDRLERLKEDIRSRHGDLSVENNKLTLFRTENSVYIKVGESRDFVLVDLMTHEVQTLKKTSVQIPLTASVTVMTFRDFVAEMTASLYEQSWADHKSEQAEALATRKTLEASAEDLTSLRATLIVDGISAALKASVPALEKPAERAISSLKQ